MVQENFLMMVISHVKNVQEIIISRHLVELDAFLVVVATSPPAWVLQVPLIVPKDVSKELSLTQIKPVIIVTEGLELDNNVTLLLGFNCK